MAEITELMRLASIVVSISVLLSGMMLGIGRAIGHKKIENFGAEELIQSVINAAIIGAATIITEMITAISTEAVKNTLCENAIGQDAVSKVICLQQNTANGLFSLLQEIIKSLNIIGYYQTLSLDFGTFAIQPFTNLSALSSILAQQSMMIHTIIFIISLNIQMLEFILQNSFGIVFAIGLIFRSLFATRKVGGFLIALSIGLFIFYPSFMLVFEPPSTQIDNAMNLSILFTNNTNYTLVPIIDLTDNNAIAAKIDALSNRSSDVTVDFTGDLTYLVNVTQNAIAKAALYSIVAPIFSFIITVVFIKELGNILGGEIMSLPVLSNL